MKILLFTDTFADTNGVSRFLQDLLRHAPEVTVLTSTCKPLSFFTCKHLINLPPRWRMAIPFYPQLDIAVPSTKALEEVFFRIKPDVIHLSTPGPMGLLGRRLAKKHGVPCIGVYHTDFPAYVAHTLKVGQGIARAYMRWFYRPFSSVLARSPAHVLPLQQLLPDKSIATFSPGIDTHLFCPQHHEKCDMPTLLYVGRISMEKNVGFLLEVYAVLKTRLPSLQLRCAGDITDQALANKARALGVSLLGALPREALPELYATAHLFIFPSTTETLGQVVLESLACGTPVVVSDKGGPAGIVRHTAAPCGLALPTQSKAVWVEAIFNLLQSKAMLHGMREAAYQEEFGIQKSIRAFLARHEVLLKKEGRADPLYALKNKKSEQD